MNLLKELVDSSLDPGYARAKQQPPKPRLRVGVLVVLLIAGTMFGISMMQRTKQAPVVQQERTQLLNGIKQAKATNQELAKQLAAEQDEIRKLTEQALGDDSSIKAQLSDVEVLSGAVAVTGPGITIIVDDAEQLDTKESLVIDQDLRQLVNGLWASGAEAVAINGHRITTRTAIRNAGAAITVDYSSLTRPYKIEAIGDPKTLPASFAQSSGGVWWNFLRTNYKMRFEINRSNSLLLPADSNLGLSKAGPVK